PRSYSRMIPAPAHVELEAPSTKIIHLSASSAGDAGLVISATKSAHTCSFRAFLLS
ncbi:hypothetical protein A2U01_0110692, partial [Trifolium medium]|nr:hypothetical protein [Trifolium medium]